MPVHPSVQSAYRLLDDVELTHMFSRAIVDRRRDYAHGHHVVAVEVGGRLLVRGMVLGSGALYAVEVEVFLDTNGVELSTICTCPMGGDCKHVVALSVTARDSLADDR